jgi:hypothetical protein
MGDGQRPVWAPPNRDCFGDGYALGELGVAGALSNFLSALAPYWDLVPLGSDGKCFTRLLAECGRVIDRRDRAVVDRLRNRDWWNLDHLAKSGRQRPWLILDAHVTQVGNVSLRVFPDADDWRWFPRQTEKFRRPDNEIAVLHGGGGALRQFHDQNEWDRSLRESLRIGFWIERQMGFFVCKAFEAAHAMLAEHFDVALASSIEIRNVGPHKRACLVAIEERDRREVEMRAAAERQALKAAVAARRDAAALMIWAAGTPHRVVSTLRALRALAEQGVGEAERLAVWKHAKLRGDDADFKRRVSELEAAYDEFGPGWRDYASSGLERQLLGFLSRGDRRRADRRRAAPVHRSDDRIVDAPAQRCVVFEPALYRASAAELAEAGVASVVALVDEVDSLLLGEGGFPLTRSQIPTSQGRFRPLVRMLAGLRRRAAAVKVEASAERVG